MISNNKINEIYYFTKNQNEFSAIISNYKYTYMEILDDDYNYFKNFSNYYTLMYIIDHHLELEPDVVNIIYLNDLKLYRELTKPQTNNLNVSLSLDWVELNNFLKNNRKNFIIVYLNEVEQKNNKYMSYLINN